MKPLTSLILGTVLNPDMFCISVVQTGKRILQYHLVALFFSGSLFFADGLTAQTMEAVLSQVGERIEKQFPGDNANKKISIHLVESISGTVDSVAEDLARQLELKIRRHLLKNRSYSEPVDPFEIQIKGAYKRAGINVDLTFKIQHYHPLTEETEKLEQSVRFEYLEDSPQKHVLILDIQSPELDKILNSRFSNELREEITKRQIFTPGQRGFRPDVSNCRSVSCLSDLGKQLDIDYLLLPRLDKIGNWKYILGADLIDVKDRSIKGKIDIHHNGRLSFLSGSIAELANRLFLQEQMMAAAEAGIKREMGSISITSEPSEADVYLDEKRLDQTTNLLLEKIEAGMHTVVIKKGSLQRTFKFVLNAGETRHLHALLQPFQVSSFKLVRDPADPLKIEFQIDYSLPVDPASVTDQTFFVQKGAGKLPGIIKIDSNVIIFSPAKPLQYGRTYKIIATRAVRSEFGDTPDLLYERRYRTSPYPVETDPNILIFSESHGPESWVKNRRGVLKVGVSSFIPLKHIDINGQRLELQDKTIMEREIPFEFSERQQKFSYLVTALTEEGKSQKRFVIHFGRKPERKKSPLQLITMLKYSNNDNLYSTSSEIENISASKTTLTLMPIYTFITGERSRLKLKGIILRDMMDDDQHSSKENSYTQIALEWLLSKTFVGTLKTEFGYNDYKTDNADIFVGEEESKSQVFLNLGSQVNFDKVSRFEFELSAISQTEANPATEDDDASGFITGLTTSYQFELLGAKSRIKLKIEELDASGQYKDNTETGMEAKQDYSWGNWLPSWSYALTSTAYKQKDTRLTVEGIAIENTLAALTLKLGYKLFDSTKLELEVKNKKQESNVLSYNYEATIIALGVSLQL
ncbi:PEGA domain-containing protein [bacterium]|nr:PEGA domain-containing protein [bacterium]